MHFSRSIWRLFCIHAKYSYPEVNTAETLQPVMSTRRILNSRTNQSAEILIVDRTEIYEGFSIAVSLVSRRMHLTICSNSSLHCVSFSLVINYAAYGNTNRYAAIR